MALTGKISDAAIEQLVQETIAFAAGKGWGTLQKSHKVLALLKKVGLVDLKKDFGAIYTLERQVFPTFGTGQVVHLLLAFSRWLSRVLGTANS